MDFEKFNIRLSILLVKEALSVLSVWNENYCLNVVLPFFIFVFKILCEIYKEFLGCFIVTNLAINEKSEKFWYGVNDGL